MISSYIPLLSWIFFVLLPTWSKTVEIPPPVQCSGPPHSEESWWRCSDKAQLALWVWGILTKSSQAKNSIGHHPKVWWSTFSTFSISIHLQTVITEGIETSDLNLCLVVWAVLCNVRYVKLHELLELCELPLVALVLITNTLSCMSFVICVICMELCDFPSVALIL